MGLGFFAILLSIISQKCVEWPIKISLAIIVLMVTCLGSIYLIINFKKCMAITEKIVMINQYFGAFDNDFLDELGPLMHSKWKEWSKGKLTKDFVSFSYIVVLCVGGIITIFAIILI